MEKTLEKTPGTVKDDPKYDRPVWYLPGPFYRYNEDVKRLAAKHGLRIIDADVTPDREGAADPKDLPVVTVNPAYMTKAEKAAAEATAEAAKAAAQTKK